MEIIISIIGLFLSFLFAGSETAYLTTNQLRLEIWIRKKIRSANLAKKLGLGNWQNMSTISIFYDFYGILGIGNHRLGEEIQSSNCPKFDSGLDDITGIHNVSKISIYRIYLKILDIL